MEDQQMPTGSEGTREDIPDWWRYAAEFPQWHVWRGVSGLVSARQSWSAGRIPWTCEIRSGA
jgi:hypothetical protein